MDNRLKIINYLGKNLGMPFTMREVSKATRIPYATFHRTIGVMTQTIEIQPVGKSKTITLNVNNPVIGSYLAVSSNEEKNNYLKKYPLIAKLASELDQKQTVLLFGSYAKGNERRDSDIDLMVINRKGDKTFSLSKYELLFRKKINIIFLSNTEFIKMLKDKAENVGKQVLKGHIILTNPEGFWRCVLNG